MVTKETGVGVEQRSLVRLGIGHVVHEHEQDFPIHQKADTNAVGKIGTMVCLTYEEGGVKLCAFTGQRIGLKGSSYQRQRWPSQEFAKASCHFKDTEKKKLSVQRFGDHDGR